MRATRSLSFLGLVALSSGCCAGPEAAPEAPRAASVAAPTPAAPAAPTPAEAVAQVESGARSWPAPEAWPADGQVVVRGRGAGRALGGSAVTFEPGPLGEVLATISRQADVNLVPEPGIDLEVVVEWGLREVAWRDALLLLCQRYQLEDRRIGERTLYVTRPPRVTIQ